MTRWQCSPGPRCGAHLRTTRAELNGNFEADGPGARALERDIDALEQAYA